MSEALNVTKAAFGGLREVTTAPLWQYDYGQILKITGLDLPQAFEVHFSNSRKSGETVTQIGTDSQVVIPDMYLTSGADIYAFIFLHDGLTDGETEYVIKIPVRERPEPSDIEPTPEQQDAITEAIAALNVAVTQTGQDVISADASATAAAQSATDAQTAAQSAQGSATSASASASTASTAAATATTKASEAATSAANAASAKTAAETAETNAQAAQTASESARASAESAAQTATTKASEASTSATNASGSASAASASASQASESATNAAASATAASASATAAAGSASTASTKASEASASATAAQTAQTAAEAAQTAAETAAATFETDTTLTVSGKAADAKATGDAVNGLKSNKLDNYTAYDFSVTNSRINASGAFVFHNNYYRTDYIPCIPNMVVKFHGRSAWHQGEPIVSLLAFYDANKTFISSITKFSDTETSNTTGYLEATVPNNAYYVAGCTSTLADDFYFHLRDVRNLIDSIPSIEDDLSKTFFNVNDTSVNNLDWIIGSFNSGTGAEIASTTRVRSKFIKVGKGTTLRINDSATYSYLYYLFDLNKKFIVAKDWTTKDITIENDCYIRILVRYTNNRTITEDTRISVASQLQLFFVAPTYETIDANIIYNIPANTRKKAEIEVFKQKKTSSEAYAQCDAKIMFYTDVHGDSDRTMRMKQLVKNWGTSYFDVAVCGGDIAEYTINESLDWYYDDIDGIGVPVLNAVGNHDAWASMSPVTLAPQTDVYNKIIAPIVSSAGITQPTGASTNGYCYYYKDIGAVRIIVLDCMHWDATQLAWFVSVLSDSKANSKHVLCVSHSAFPIANMEKVDCLWSKSGINTDGTRTNIQAASAVKDFIDAGGKFVAWIVGHQHGDYVHKLPDYGNQFVVNLSSFAQRAGWLLKNTDPTAYNYDCLTYIAIDTSNSIIKFMRIGADVDIFGTQYHGLVIDYNNNQLISDY